MLPGDGGFSDLAPPSSFVAKHRQVLTEDYEKGGVALNDPSKGLVFQLWYTWTDGTSVFLDAPNQEPRTLFSRDGTIEEVSLAFDQNMEVFIAFVEDGQAWYRAPGDGGFSFTAMDADVVSPRCALDYRAQPSISDIILAYVRAGDLYYRQQRDRYETEYLLQQTVGPRLRDLGLNKDYRLQFIMER